ncbi:MAG: SUMF1/EgtB/PvdO family nonheme iron enzyme [Planctomycetales bacterium]
MQEREIFLSAMEIEEPEARKTHLESACGGDGELLARVEALLASHDGQSEFLNTPVADQVADGGADDSARFDATVLHASSQDDDPNAATSVSDPNDPANEDQETRGDEKLLSYLQPSTKPDSLGRLAQYEILEVIGSGAFGTVLKAFDEKLQRVVAVKVLAPEMAATSPARKRFLREARSSAAVRHENVVSVYAVEDDPIPYLVMEYIPGQTLQQRLDQHGPLDLTHVLRLGKQIADGLAAAHAEQLIHRDVKPGNILLESSVEDRVKITDFGLARAVDDASMTQSGMIAGTPLYMAPEQALGESLDQRADLFSLGSVLYQMLSGRPPFRAPTTLAVLKRVTEDAPRPISEIISEVPDWMCEIVAKLHAKKPEDRYDSAREVADLLAKCLDDLKAGRAPENVARQAAAVESVPSESASEGSVEIPSRDRRPTSRSLLHKIAAVVLVALVGLGISDATGFTELADSVMRLAFGEGVLVIETDDPNVQVSIDGENITITGVGFKELTLRAGEYKVAALKDGKPFKQEIVNITHNGKIVLRMTLVSDDEKKELAKTPDRPRDGSSRYQWPQGSPAPAITPFDSAQAKKHQQAWAKYLGVPVEKEIVLGKDKDGKNVKLIMMLIPPGEFPMGSDGAEINKWVKEAEADGAENLSLTMIRREGPLRWVRITKPFWLSRGEFTTGQFRAFVNDDDHEVDSKKDEQGGVAWVKGKPVRDSKYSWQHIGYDVPPNHPAVNVSWNDATACCAWLSKQHPDMAFSLPTEARWEYACRAGTTTPWHCGADDENLHHYATVRGHGNWLKPVETLRPNGFGLRDMHGNAWEWCSDWFGNYGDAGKEDPIGAEKGEHRILRGGNFFNKPRGLRSAARWGAKQDNGRFDRGFRVAATVSDKVIQDAVSQEENSGIATPKEVGAIHALSFDGTPNTCVEIPTLNLQEKDAVTLEAFIRLDSLKPMSIVGSPGSIGIGSRDKKFGFWRGEHLDADQRSRTSDKVIHVAGVHDGKSTALFVNGVLQSRAEESISRAPLAMFRVGGKELHPSVSPFRGVISEIRVSNVARYDKDFTQRERLEADEHTLALYHFDEGQGDVLKDSSGNGRHGKIVGAKWVTVDAASLTENARQPSGDPALPAIAPFDSGQAEKHQPPTLPQAGASADVADQPIVVTISEKGEVFVNAEKVAFGQLEARLRELVASSPKKTITIRGDENTPYEYFVRALDAAKNIGAARVKFLDPR